MANKGVKFEHDIIECYRKMPLTVAPPQSDEAAYAAYLLKQKFPNAKLLHRDEVTLKGLGREIKADFWVLHRDEEPIGVSVKMAGPIQLSSAEGKRTASIFEQVAGSLESSRRELLTNIVETIGSLPRIMLARNNRPKALKRKPHLVADAVDYDKWWQDERPHINAALDKVFEDREIREAVVEEMLTGRKQFAGTEGVADYILTPKYFKYIDKQYVQSVAEDVRINVRGKSRAGISSGVVRFDSKI